MAAPGRGLEFEFRLAARQDRRACDECLYGSVLIWQNIRDFCQQKSRFRFSRNSAASHFHDLGSPGQASTTFSIRAPDDRTMVTVRAPWMLSGKCAAFSVSLPGICRFTSMTHNARAQRPKHAGVPFAYSEKGMTVCFGPSGVLS
jgi:hypothetical protein